MRGMSRYFSATSKAVFKFSYVFRELAVVDEVGPVPVDECAERKTILEGQVEVLHVHVLVRSGLALTPQEETFLQL
jgi:hypothetical protein